MCAGLPDSIRNDVQRISESNTNDSGSDGEGGTRSPGTFHDSLAEVSTRLVEMGWICSPIG